MRHSMMHIPQPSYELHVTDFGYTLVHLSFGGGDAAKDQQTEGS